MGTGVEAGRAGEGGGGGGGDGGKWSIVLRLKVSRAQGGEDRRQTNVRGVQCLF